MEQSLDIKAQVLNSKWDAKSRVNILMVAPGGNVLHDFYTGQHFLNTFTHLTTVA